MNKSKEMWVVCLYSKYSEKCVRFFEDMAYMRGIKMVCVDHEDARSLVERDSPGYRVERVPCILAFHEDGRMDKFEAEDAFEWLDDRKRRMCRSSDRLSRLTEVMPPPPEPVMTPAAPAPLVDLEEIVERTPGDPVPIDVPITERSATEKPASIKKKESIMATAMSMAKQREDEYESKDPKRLAVEAANRQAS